MLVKSSVKERSFSIYEKSLTELPSFIQKDSIDLLGVL